jgi:hypothetical protein
LLSSRKSVDCFVARRACAVFLLQFRFRNFLLLGFCSFFLERWQGSSCVELARLIILFDAGLAQLFLWLTWVSV